MLWHLKAELSCRVLGSLSLTAWWPWAAAAAPTRHPLVGLGPAPVPCGLGNSGMALSLSAPQSGGVPPPGSPGGLGRVAAVGELWAWHRSPFLGPPALAQQRGCSAPTGYWMSCCEQPPPPPPFSPQIAVETDFGVNVGKACKSRGLANPPSLPLWWGVVWIWLLGVMEGGFQNKGGSLREGVGGSLVFSA